MAPEAPETPTLDLRGRSPDWLIPYKSIDLELQRRGRVRVIVPREGMANDIQLWAELKGYRITKKFIHRAGIEIELEIPKEATADSKELPKEILHERRLQSISAKISDPIFRVDIILASRDTYRITAKIASHEELINRIVSVTGRRSMYVEVEYTSQKIRFELLLRRGEVVGAVLSIDDTVYLGGDALKKFDELVASRDVELSVRATIIDEELIERLEAVATR